MNSELYGLDGSILQNLRLTFQRNPKITQVLIYGSRAMGTQRINSDIDLTLIGNNLDHSDLLSVAEKIDELMMAYKVDLSIYAQIDNPSLKEHINRVGKEIYSISR